MGFQIALVADQDSADVVAGVLLNFGHPVLDCGEGVTIRDVVSHDDTVCALVVGGSDGLESFLAGGVPNLELDGLSIDFVVSDLEIDTNGWHEVVCEHIILK